MTVGGLVRAPVSCVPVSWPVYPCHVYPCHDTGTHDTGTSAGQPYIVTFGGWYKNDRPVPIMPAKAGTQRRKLAGPYGFWPTLSYQGSVADEGTRLTRVPG